MDKVKKLIKGFITIILAMVISIFCGTTISIGTGGVQRGTEGRSRC